MRGILEILAPISAYQPSKEVLQDGSLFQRPAKVFKCADFSILEMIPLIAASLSDGWVNDVAV
jgi:hypothetical protein